MPESPEVESAADRARAALIEKSRAWEAFDRALSAGEDVNALALEVERAERTHDRAQAALLAELHAGTSAAVAFGAPVDDRVPAHVARCVAWSVEALDAIERVQDLGRRGTLEGPEGAQAIADSERLLAAGEALKAERRQLVSEHARAVEAAHGQAQ